jgi:hypothetical protein
MLADFLIQDDTLENWKQDFVLLHNYFSSICIRNTVLLCASHDWFQVQSTPRMTFRQGKDHADMKTMLTSMCGAWIGEDRVQQGFISQEGGPRLIQFESPRWRPKRIQVRSQFGVPDQYTLKTTPKSHTKSVLDVGWKQNFMMFPMALVWGTNSSWVNGNHQKKWTSRICQGAAPIPFGLLAQ